MWRAPGSNVFPCWEEGYERVADRPDHALERAAPHPDRPGRTGRLRLEESSAPRCAAPPRPAARSRRRAGDLRLRLAATVSPSKASADAGSAPAGSRARARAGQRRRAAVRWPGLPLRADRAPAASRERRVPGGGDDRDEHQRRRAERRRNAGTTTASPSSRPAQVYRSDAGQAHAGGRPADGPSSWARPARRSTPTSTAG